MVQQTQQRFPQFVACSFDKGFHSPNNQTELKQHLELVALPRKGKLSQAAKEIEGSPEFVHARRKHSAVESAINALEAGRSRYVLLYASRVFLAKFNEMK